MKTGEINYPRVPSRPKGLTLSWFGYQRNQPSDKIQWLKYDVRGAIAPGCFQLIAHLTIARKRQAFGGYRRSCDIAFILPVLVLVIALGGAGFDIYHLDIKLVKKAS